MTRQQLALIRTLLDAAHETLANRGRNLQSLREAVSQCSKYDLDLAPVDNQAPVVEWFGGFDGRWLN